jgi:hypothetical protein
MPEFGSTSGSIDIGGLTAIGAVLLGLAFLIAVMVRGVRRPEKRLCLTFPANWA